MQEARPRPTRLSRKVAYASSSRATDKILRTCMVDKIWLTRHRPRGFRLFYRSCSRSFVACPYPWAYLPWIWELVVLALLACTLKVLRGYGRMRKTDWMTDVTCKPLLAALAAFSQDHIPSSSKHHTTTQYFGTAPDLAPYRAHTCPTLLQPELKLSASSSEG
jgi:hypothetical protein